VDSLTARGDIPVSEEGFRMAGETHPQDCHRLETRSAIEYPADAVIRSDGTHLVTGGRGDLGLTFAKWHQNRGSLPGADGAKQTCGSNRLSMSCKRRRYGDDSPVRRDRLQPAGWSNRPVKQSLPPLKRSCMAGLLADGTLMQMEWNVLWRICQSAGAWNYTA
jgi:hypothetical protein